jgi:hypothetical protein
MAEVAFYCMSSELYFPGAVGLVNSLRLVGHREPIYLLDCGLTPAHRDLLAPHVALVEGSSDVEPFLLKTVAPTGHPAEVMVLIDADMVVTRPLTPLIEQAAEGRVVAFKDNLDRFVPEWGEALDLGQANPRPYVSSGLVALGGPVGADVLRLMDDRKRRVDIERSYYGSNVPDYPFRYLDQDLLNAILATRVDPDRAVVVEGRLAPHQPYRGLRLVDEATLRCAYRDGAEPYVLHQYLRKPWIEPMYHGLYSRLLARLLLGPDVSIRFPESELPLRMRQGLVARVERKRVDAQDLVRWYVRDVIPEWIAERRARVTGGG